MIVQFSDHARQDIREAVAWYERQAPGLGRPLVDDLIRLMGRVKAFPNAYPRVRGEYRQASLSRFPYAVIYAHQTDGLVVIAFRHKRRDSAALSDRFSE